MVQSWLESIVTCVGVLVDSSKSVTVAGGEPLVELFEQPMTNPAIKATPVIICDVRINLNDA